MPTVLELYEKLKPKLGEEEAKGLLEFVEASVERKAATKEDLQLTEMALREDLMALKEDLRRTEMALREDLMALREDLRRTDTSLREDLRRTDTSLREDLRQMETSLREDLRQMETSLREDIRRTETALREEIHRLDQKVEATKADLIKWTFGFWITNVVVLSGIMFALLRAFGGK